MRARENARRSNCQSNLRQLGIAMAMYSQDYDERIMPQYITAPGQGYWHVLVKPYIKTLQILICRSESRVFVGAPPQTNYGYNVTGNGSLGGFYDASGNSVSPNDIRLLAALPSPTETIALADAVCWNNESPGPYYGGGPNILYHATNPTTGNMTYYVHPRHFEGANFSFMDGHVKFMKTPVAQRFFTVADD